MSICSSADFHVNEFDLYDTMVNVPNKPCNPIDPTMTFLAYRNTNMTKITDQIWKKVLRAGRKNSLLDIKTTFEELRIFYAIEVYQENKEEPVMLINKAIFSVQEGLECIRGIAEALRNLNIGEEALFWIPSQLMYRKGDVIVKMRMIQAEKCKMIDSSNNQFNQTLDKAHTLKCKAERLMNEQNFADSAYLFKRITRILDTHMKSEQEEQQNKELLTSAYLNAAQCFLKLRQYNKVCVMIRDLGYIINVDNHVEALYLKGMAILGFKEFSRARNILLQAHRLNRKNEKIWNALKQVDLEKDKIVKREMKEKIVEEHDRQEKIKWENRKQETMKNENRKKQETQMKFDENMKTLRESIKKFIENIKDSEFKYHEIDFELRDEVEVHYADKLCGQMGYKLKDMLLRSELVYYLEKLGENRKNSIFEKQPIMQ